MQSYTGGVPNGINDYSQARRFHAEDPRVCCASSGDEYSGPLTAGITEVVSRLSHVEAEFAHLKEKLAPVLAAEQPEPPSAAKPTCVSPCQSPVTARLFDLAERVGELGLKINRCLGRLEV